MNKIFNRLFLTTFVITLCSLVILGARLKIALPDYSILLILGTLTSVILTITIRSLFLQPIEQMQQITEKITQGDYKGRLSLYRKDELGELANNLNEMSLELQNKISQIMQDKNELTAILSSMIEGVVVIGKDEKILLLSPPVRNMLELRSKETVGKFYWEVIRNVEINALLEEAIKQKKALQREITIFSPHENNFSVQVSPIFKDNADFTGVVTVFHDITELKRFTRLRSEFVANVSHELKTPLTTIKGFVETLRDGAMNDKEKSKKFLDIIQKHTERLEYLVNDLLTLSSIESKEIGLNFEKAALIDLLESAINLCRQKLDTHLHRLTINVDQGLPSVWADKTKLEQVFVNLLDNAIKFTPSGGEIAVRAYTENGLIRIDIKDTGIGIDQQHLPRIFERFYRVDKGRSRDLGGTGLGLSIVKHIIQSHHGNITVRSELNKGSLFSVFLPSHSA